VAGRLSFSDLMADLSPLPGQARASLETMAAPLRLSATERLQLAELIRLRSLADRSGHLAVASLQTLIEEVRRGKD
jgi:hypothetical protein